MHQQGASSHHHGQVHRLRPTALLMSEAAMHRALHSRMNRIASCVMSTVRYMSEAEKKILDDYL